MPVQLRFIKSKDMQIAYQPEIFGENKSHYHRLAMNITAYGSLIRRCKLRDLVSHGLKHNCSKSASGFRKMWKENFLDGVPPNWTTLLGDTQFAD